MGPCLRLDEFVLLCRVLRRLWRRDQALDRLLYAFLIPI